MLPAHKISPNGPRLDSVVGHLQRTFGDSLLIRKANQTDTQAVFAFINAVRAEYGYPDCVENEIAEGKFKEFYDGRNGIFILLESKGRLVGTIAGRALPGLEMELQKFYLARDLRGQGLGSTVCSEFIQGFFTLGYRSILLETNRCFHGANRMYRSMGFIPTPTSKRRALAENVWMRLRK